MTRKALLIDIDGVLYVGDNPVPGAREAIARLEDAGYRFRFLSNTTRKCRKTIAARLSKMGFGIDQDRLFTPSVAAARYLRERGIKSCHLLTTGDVDRDFEEAGIRHEDDAACIVIGDAGDEFTYGRMNRVFRLALGNAGLVALERDRYWMGPDGLMLGAGPFVAALEYASGKEAILVGKPSPSFFMLALQDMDARPEEALMVGDDIATDIKGAKMLGLRAALVKTGKYRPETLAAADVRPDFVIRSIAGIDEVLGGI
ncbi:MAG: TIGR01458 family HAD-type hydrolase [Methanoregulaceae archaeon]|nr:TIGR01458 family HAD-type hydrolase [Methanoregulaceae archaeon]